jgi:NADH:ubiquinone oxidoreductase subunit 3 (subunit A)
MNTFLENKESAVCSSKKVFKFKIITLLQLLLIGFLLNPWVAILRELAVCILVAEVLITILTGLPVFLYQFLIKRLSWKDSMQVTINVIIDTILFTPFV